MAKSKGVTLGEDADNLKIEMANCLFSWSTLEIHLSGIFSGIVNTEEAVAFHIWDSVISFEAKLKCLTSVIEVVVKDKELLQIWAKLANKISDSAKRRNQIAHSGFLGKEFKYGHRAVLIPYLSIGLHDHPKERQNPQYLVSEDLEQLSSAFGELVSACFWFRAMTDRTERPLPESARQAPDLIIQIQNSIAQNPVKQKRQKKS